jgi:hypothetical protein
MTNEQKGSSQTERRGWSRKNKRINLRLPVRIEVPMEMGRTRVLDSHTVVVSHAGATLDLAEPIPAGIGLQVSPPFGGTILAEVNGSWLDHATGRYRVSIRLIDPTSWTSPERFSASCTTTQEPAGLCVSPGVSQMLAEYAAFISETAGEQITPEVAAEHILEQAFFADRKFQDWFASKIMEDLTAWEESFVLREG